MSKEKVAEEKEQVENNTAENQEEKNPKQEGHEEINDNSNTDESSDEVNQEDLVKEANEKYLRLYSEFENFRRRTAKEKLELIATASEDVIKDLLPVLDDFERAIKTNEDSEDIESLKEGFVLLHQKIHSILKSKGLVEMDSNGKDFNIDEHEALTKIPSPSKDLKGKVVDVIEKGYKLKDKVIRYAKVVVGE
jgi:molecular chaperone GrpE